MNGIGITPAYTGNTEFETSEFKHEKDHPRIHGEHTTS